MCHVFHCNYFYRLVQQLSHVFCVFFVSYSGEWMLHSALCDFEKIGMRMHKQQINQTFFYDEETAVSFSYA